MNVQRRITERKRIHFKSRRSKSFSRTKLSWGHFEGLLSKCGQNRLRAGVGQRMDISRCTCRRQKNRPTTWRKDVATQRHTSTCLGERMQNFSFWWTFGLCSTKVAEEIKTGVLSVWIKLRFQNIWIALANIISICRDHARLGEDAEKSFTFLIPCLTVRSVTCYKT